LGANRGVCVQLGVQLHYSIKLNTAINISFDLITKEVSYIFKHNNIIRIPSFTAIKAKQHFKLVLINCL